MKTLAILPVKAFGAAKQRLSPDVGADPRRALAQAMVSDVLAALAAAERLDAIVVVTADEHAAGLARAAGAHVLADAAQAGQSPAAEIGIAYAVAHGYDRVALVPGDAPLLDPAELDGLLERAASDGPGVAIVPDRHGTGTNALLLQPPDVIAPSFGPGSFARHRAGARAAGVAAHVEPLPTLVLDVDTRADLERVASVLAERPGLAPNTRAALAERAPV